MDFHNLSRRELQFLCKLNKIPANITNIAMADALTSLVNVLGIEEICNPSQSSESLEKVQETDVSRTVGTFKKESDTRRSARLAEKRSVDIGVMGMVSQQGNDSVKAKNVYFHVDNLNRDSEGILNPPGGDEYPEEISEVVDSENPELQVVISSCDDIDPNDDEKNDTEAFNVEEHSDSFLYEKTKTSLLLSDFDDIAISNDTNDHLDLESQEISSHVSSGSPTMTVKVITELLKSSDAESYDSENLNDHLDLKCKDMSSAAVSETTSEISEFIGSPSMLMDSNDFITETPNKLSKLDSPDNQNVGKDLTAEGLDDDISLNTGSSDMVGDLIPFITKLESRDSTIATQITADAIEENISENTEFSAPLVAHKSLIDETAVGQQIIPSGHKTKHESVVDVVLVNSNERELGKGFSAYVEEDECLINETPVECQLDLGSEQLYQEAEQIIADCDDVKNESRSVSVTTDVSEDRENRGRTLQAAAGEEDQTIVENTVSEKPKGVRDYSIRFLKKQLKALSTKHEYQQRS